MITPLDSEQDEGDEQEAQVPGDDEHHQAWGDHSIPQERYYK